MVDLDTQEEVKQRYWIFFFNLKRVERLYRDLKAFVIGGGSEEILLDFGVKQAMKFSKL
jgi:hypothetical protein